MSYFAKPNFIIYDEWFDEDLEITKINIKNKKIQTASNIHEFFYKMSNYKVGASENNFKLRTKVNEKKLFKNNYLEKTSVEFISLSNKRFRLFDNLTITNLRYKIVKKFIYSLSISGFIVIFGFLIFFISQYKKNQTNTSNISFSLEREFDFFKRDH